ncbi:alpha/beta hydrolase, partial [Thioclava sp. BHET1]
NRPPSISRKLALIDLALAAAGAAGVAAATRARILSRAATAARQFPPTGQLITVAGRRVHVHQAGHGPDLVLIHGASGNSRDFTFSMVERLAPRYRVTAFDRPGLGWSDPLPHGGADPAAQAQHLRQAAARLGLSRPIVLGQSYGGTIALAWALAAPQQVAALVLVAAASNPWQGSLGPWYRMTASWPGYHLLLPLVSAWASPARLNRAVAEVFAPDSAPPGYGD